MKKFLFLSLVLCFQSVFSQIRMSGNKLMKDGQTYKMSQYNEVFKNPEALIYFKKARTNGTVGSIFAGVGGGFMGFGLERALSGGKTTITTNAGPQTIKQNNSGAWALVGIGAGLVGIGIPFALAAKKNSEKAIKAENGESTAFQPYFKIETAGNALALSYNF
jgi:predicted phage tail protein